MRDRRRWPIRTRSTTLGKLCLLSLTIGVALFFFGQEAVRAASESSLNPKGPVAGTISRLSWVLFAIAGLVFISVVGVMIFGAMRRPRGPVDENGVIGRAPREDHRIITVGGILIPAVILIGIFAYSLRDMISLAKPDTAAAMTINVVGHQWWWEVQYQNLGVTTANEIHIPTGVPIQFDLTTDDVIHSFWVPNLASKRDLIPNQVNKLWLQADSAGTYQGQCAEYCGTMHGLMNFIVVAQSPDQYAAWLANEQKPSGISDDPLIVEGQQAFLGSACVYCHAVRGTAASGNIGPDLTHLASRQTLAAGVIANTKGNLAGWITAPQSIKPDAKMPGIVMNPDEFKALLAYLESLT